MRPTIKGKDFYKSLVEERGKPLRDTETFRLVEEATQKAAAGEPGGMSLSDCSIRDLFANLVVNKSNGEPVGEAFIREYMNPADDGERLLETGGAMGAVDSSLFMGITGQLLVVSVLKQYQQEAFVASGMIPTYPTPLKEERIPGVTIPKDPDMSGKEDVTEVPENIPYRTVGFTERYIERDITVRRGLIIPVTRDAIFFDLTGQVASRAGEVGYLLGLRKEKRALGMMIGGTVNPIRFHEKEAFDSAAVTIDLFQAAAGTGQYQLADVAFYPDRPYPFVNDIPGNPLTDYTNMRLADQQFSKTVDPSTGEPIVVGKPFIFAPQTRAYDLPQVLQAINIWKVSQAGMDTAGAIMTQSPNPIPKAVGMPDFKLSRQLRAQIVQQLYGGTDNGTAADKIWFYGDPAEAFAYAENRPMTVVQAPPNSEAEFMQDIVLRFKASERGQFFIKNPRVWQRHNFNSQV